MYSNINSFLSFNVYMQKRCTVNMSDRIAEHLQGYGWWINELDSLGIKAESKDDKSNRQQLIDLTENTKQHLYNDYKSRLVNT
jgi:hypothetical protein